MNKKIAILGGGESGVGTALLAKKVGYDIWVSDKGSIAEKYKNELVANEISFEENIHTESQILNVDIVMKSPGIPDSAPIVKIIKERNIPVVSEVEFGFRYQNSKIIGITGSNGKTTTTNLLYHILSEAGLDVGMVGNVGISFARMVATNPKEYYVLEVSSFQLDDVEQFKCDVAILLNITPDHLDRYEYQMEKYVASKFNINLNQEAENKFIYSIDDEEITNYISQNKERFKADLVPFSITKKLENGGYVEDEQLIIKTNKTQFNMPIQELTIKGKHNQYNSLAAGIAARAFDIKDDVLKAAFQTFKSIPHRMERVLSIQGVEYINDSKATNVNSTWYALESMEKNSVWIVGGVDKGNDYQVLLPLVKEKVKAIVCLGENNIKIHEAFGDVVDVMINTENMKDAVKQASRMAKKGDVVLLSPCCASFDLFENYEDRGEQFKQFVREL